MPHHSPLIATIVIGLLLAFVLGAIAQRVRISPLIGYLLAGVVVGPHTPGFVADQALANELAEIGVILLMFGVGLHFSLKDILSVWTIAIPGAIAQIAVATPLGVGVSWLLGWSLSAGLLFGLALSVASTVVLLRVLQDRRLIQTERGRIAVGWLIVQDLLMILALVLLPTVAEFIDGTTARGGAPPVVADVAIALAIATGKIVAFVIAMLIVGRRVIPWILHYIAHTGSRELFRLAVLAIALGVAYGGAALFGVSFALGAFFAGMILSESELSQRAAEESLPLRDAFAVLFFVSVGMLFDPTILFRDPWPLIATLLIIVLGKSIPAFLIVRAFGHSNGTSLMISASLAQIGEFSFILAGLGVTLQLLPDQGRVLILAAAILSIVLNPALLYMTERLRPLIDGPTPAAAGPAPSDRPVTEEPLVPTALRDHVVLIGYGRVGSVIGDDLRRRGLPYFVIEERPENVNQARANGIEALSGNAVDAALLKAANIAEARSLFVAIPDGFEAGQVVEQAKAIKPSLKVVARAHSDAEVAHLRQMGADSIVMGEREIALGMIEVAFPKGAEGQVSGSPGTAIP